MIFRLYAVIGARTITYMAYKNIEDSRAAIRRHYYANKEKYLEKNRKRRKELRSYLNTIKESTPCADCGTSYPYYVMDFDHLRDKQYMVSRLVLSSSIRVVKKEIEKCEVVCANCHRSRTFQRLQAQSS